MHTLNDKEIEQGLKDIEKMIDSIKQSIELIRKPNNKYPDRYKNEKRNWNLRTIQTYCNEIKDTSNFIINNSR